MANLLWITSGNHHLLKRHAASHKRSSWRNEKYEAIVFVADQLPLVPSGLQAALRVFRNVMVLTGAGISAESGIPTFRDALTGIWTYHNPQQLPTRAGFRTNPSLVLGWYELRRQAVTQVSPNSGHHALVDLATLHVVESVKIVTQNVGDLHERAESTDVVQLHGSLFAPRCMTCGRSTTFAKQELSTSVPNAPLEPPRCAHCRGLIRPGVVWFQEDLPEDCWKAACRAVGQADLLLVVGISGRVIQQPACTNWHNTKVAPFG